MAGRARGAELSAARTWKSAAIQLSVFLGLLTLIEGTAAFAPEPASPLGRGERFYPPTRVPNVEESAIQWQVDRLLREDAELVIIGDSSAMMGLEPRTFEIELGLTAQNFGTVCWLHTDGHADVLDLYLAQHGTPQVVIYQIGTLIHAVSRDEIVATGLLDNFRRWTGLGAAEHPVPLPSLLRRPQARALVEGAEYSPVYLEANRGREPSDAVVREQLELTNGMNVDHAPRGDWSNMPPPLQPYEPSVESGLVRVMEASSEFGFQLFVVHAPIPDVFDHPQVTANYDSVERAIGALADEYANASVVGPFARYLSTDAFANFEHLTPDGARFNSVVIARSIGTLLSAQREEAH